MSFEQRESPGTERLAKAVFQQTEWLLIKFQNALERNKVIYMKTDMDGVLSTIGFDSVGIILLTVDSRYLELGYLELCETRSVYLNQKYILSAFSNHTFALETFLQVRITRSAK